VLADGGPFSHLVLGHSVLHGLGAITATMGLCLAQRKEDDEGLNWRLIILLALPAFAIAVNSVSAMYCLGLVGIILFWGHLGSARTWALIILMVGLFLGALKIMGYGHAPEAAEATMKQHVAAQWWILVVWFIIGLGFRIVGFRWISKPLKDPMSAMVLASVIGLLGFSVLIQLDGNNERYGVYFLQSMFSIFAFSRLTSVCWRADERSRWSAEWLRLAKKGMIVLTVCGVLIGIIAFATHRHTAIRFFGAKLVVSFLLLLVLAGTAALMKRSPRFSAAASTIVIAVLLMGSLGWITPWLNFGAGRMKMDVTLTPGEVRGLTYLREHSAPSDRFATNRHSLDSVASYPERSYAYGALSERPVLLEGYLYHAGTALPWFPTLLRDNDLAFTATDPETVRDIAKTWHVRWLVARPGTDISLPRPLPPWIVEQQDSGDLKIYRID